MTVAGHICWSEDGSHGWYKEDTSFRMDHFKAFIRDYDLAKKEQDSLDDNDHFDAEFSRFPATAFS